MEMDGQASSGALLENFCLMDADWDSILTEDIQLIMVQKANVMKKQFTASVWKEDKWYVAQCQEVEVASQGKTEKQALKNLAEALELHFEEPTATALPKTVKLEVNIGAA